MKLVLEGVAVELDSSGNLSSRISECSGIATQLDGMEIDGVHFTMHDKGNVIEIIMKGEGLSDKITNNYPAPLYSPIKQIAFKSPDARFTANTLNKLMRWVNKELKNRALLIRDVKRLSE